jgi:aryl-alcohol dehydrogenase-like predicted oxidoreductase
VSADIATRAEGLVPLGATGYEVTRVGLGAWAIGGPWQKGWGAQDDRDSIGTILHALESGISWIDTAAVYGLGHAEEVIAEALEQVPEGERPLVFTKCGRFEDPRGGSGKVGSPELIRRGCEESMERLQVARLDLLQLHWPPEDGTPIERTWETMAALKAEGKVGALGACNCSAAQLEAIDAIAPVDVVQPPLSLINRTALEDVLPWAAAHGSGTLVYSPMQSGLLTGSFHERVGQLAEDDWRGADPEFHEPRLTRNLDLVQRLRPLASRLGASISEVAIAWALAQPGVTAAIVGARRPEQIDAWRGAAALQLDGAAQAEIAGALKSSGAGRGPIPSEKGQQ